MELHKNAANLRPEEITVLDKQMAETIQFDFSITRIHFDFLGI